MILLELLWCVVGLSAASIMSTRGRDAPTWLLFGLLAAPLAAAVVFRQLVGRTVPTQELGRQHPSDRMASERTS